MRNFRHWFLHLPEKGRHQPASSGNAYSGSFRPTQMWAMTTKQCGWALYPACPVPCPRIAFSGIVMIGSSNMESKQLDGFVEGTLDEIPNFSKSMIIINTSTCCYMTESSTTHFPFNYSTFNPTIHHPHTITLNKSIWSLTFFPSQPWSSAWSQPKRANSQSMLLKANGLHLLKMPVCWQPIIFSLTRYWYATVRGPCPMLNTLANHGFLPRDGRNFTEYNVVNGLNHGLNFNRSLGAVMFQQAIPASPNYPNATSFTL